VSGSLVDVLLGDPPGGDDRSEPDD